MKINLNPDSENLPAGHILIEAKNKETGRGTQATADCKSSIDARNAFEAIMPQWEIIKASYIPE